jgi:hypothetical protein
MEEGQCVKGPYLELCEVEEGAIDEVAMKEHDAVDASGNVQ